MFPLRFCYSFASVVAAALLASSCAHLDPEAQSDSGKMLAGVGTPVPAAGETQAVATTNADAADDPEIWVDPRDPSRAVIFGTDKQAGLYVYGLDGRVRAFLPEGKLNNVDLRSDFPTPHGDRVLVAASDRGRLGAALYLMDPATLEVRPWGVVSLDLAEPYGLCMARLGDAFVVVVNGTDGQVRQVRVEAAPDGAIRATEQRRFGLSSQTEGCVADDQRGVLYIGEEAKGVWRYPLDPAGGATGTLLAAAPSNVLQPDVEGLTLLREGAATWLIASSQGDSAFAVWRVDPPQTIYAGRFSVMGANGADPVTGTDGVAAHGGPVGPFAEGLFVAQDDSDTDGEQPSPGRARQNFKLVDWREVKRALQLP
ncbi:phytase [Phenylobacterium sp.]|uniref:phytase n=1 Tax=Phenylobacterium sp. TaxID=1871053 RepID=UPI0035ADCBBB